MPRILLADDDPELRAVLTVALTEAGYSVETAADGQQALAMVDASPPDLLITDVVMPGLSGWIVFTRLRKRVPPLPIIVISGARSGVPPEETTYPGQAVFLPKPCDLPHLLATVRRLLAGSPSAESAGLTPGSASR
jgi:DNA-binding response OmpR family regulator